MSRPPTPADEAGRLAALRGLDILDTPPERDFDDVAALASAICGTPVALVSLVDGDRQWFKARVGTDATETPRDLAFCGHAVARDGCDLFVVPDATRDHRFHDNPLVTGAFGLRFYAGAPLVVDGRHAVGTLCVIDRVPRELTAAQADALRVLARQAANLLLLRRSVAGLSAALAGRERAEAELQHQKALLESQAEASVDGILAVSAEGRILCRNRRFGELWGIPEETLRAGSDAAALDAVRPMLPDPDGFVRRVAELMARPDTTVRDEVRLLDGRVLDRYSAPLRGPDGAAIGRVWYFRDVTDRRAAEDRLRHASLHDALTGLPNRAMLLDRVGRCLDRSRRDPGYRFALLFLDLDRFKVVNDSLGHAAGDRLLTAVAGRLSSCLRGSDVIAR
ncbi:MAG TPA: diguanylate cyclase, partial [Humisphaera sp.]